MTKRKGTNVLSLLLALVMAFALFWTALPAKAEDNVDALGPVTSKDVIYQIITDRFYDGDTSNNVPAGFDATLYDGSGALVANTKAESR